MKKNIIFYVAIALLLLGGIFLFTRKNEKTTSAKVKTVTTVHTDTIHDTIPELVSQSFVRRDTVRLPISHKKGDSLTHSASKDSSDVIIPITQKVYNTKDYKAYVSGYNQKLDSIDIYRKTVTVTNTVTIQKKPSKWGIGFQVGYGVGKSGLSPYIGIGLNYKIW
jgi:hypothetical protein